MDCHNQSHGAAPFWKSQSAQLTPRLPEMPSINKVSPLPDMASLLLFFAYIYCQNCHVWASLIVGLEGYLPRKVPAGYPPSGLQCK